MEWKDQYKHPNWQRKRLEALEDAGYECIRCGDGESQLHVHHKRYVRGRMIWDYELEELECLCETCHDQAHADKDALNGFIAKLDQRAIPEVLGVLIGYCEERLSIANASADDQQFVITNAEDIRAGVHAAIFANNGWKSGLA